MADLQPGMAEKLIDAIMLEDCPFCGTEMEIQEAFNRGQKKVKYAYHPGGQNCILGGMHFDMKRWNTRPGENAAVLATLEEAVARIELTRGAEHKIGGMNPNPDRQMGREEGLSRAGEVVTKFMEEING